MKKGLRRGTHPLFGAPIPLETSPDEEGIKTGEDEESSARGRLWRQALMKKGLGT